MPPEGRAGASAGRRRPSQPAVVALRVLLTGASGLVGTWLRRRRPAGVDLWSVVHSAAVTRGATVPADLRRIEDVQAAVERSQPDLILHAAYRLSHRAIVAASSNVADVAAARGCGLVLLSTEAVFSGDGRVRAEGDRPDPVWDYGRWKAAAEDRVVATVADAAVVRLPLVISRDPPDGATRRVLAAAATGEPVGWYEDEIRQPARAADVADALWRIAGLPAAQRRGHWHLPGPQDLTRLEMGRRIGRALGLPDRLNQPEAAPSASQRPHDLRLGGERARAVIGWSPAPVP